MSWRRLRTLVVREVRATLRDRFTLTTLVLVPIIALLAFGFVLSTEVKHLKLGVVDASASPASRRLVAELAAQGTFETISFTTREAIERALVGGRIGAALVIPPDFERGLANRAQGGDPPEIQVIYDGGETVLAGNADAFLRSLLAATQGDLVAPDPRHDPAAQALRDASPDGDRGVAVVTRALFNPRLEGIPFMVAGTFGFVLSFLTTLITAVSIVSERLTGTFDQLQVTPASSLEILLGKLLPLGAVFALDVAIMVVVAGLLMGVWPAGSVAFFLAVSSFYVVTSLSMGLIFSATSATAAEAVQKTVLFSIPLVQLSGFAFPIRNMPKGVQWLAEAFPATHYIRVARAIYLRGQGPLALWPELLLLLLFGFGLVAVALRTLERRA
jgi:ABC-2 type transport system permease protein